MGALRICLSSLALTAPRSRLRKQRHFRGMVALSSRVSGSATSTSTPATARMPIIILRSAKQLEEDGKLSAEKRAALQSVLVGSGNGKCNAAVERFLNDNGIEKIA